MKVLSVVVLILFVIAGATIAVATPAVATEVTSPGLEWIWSESDWYTNDDGICQIDLSLKWYIGAGSDNNFGLAGNKEDDPVVSQLVTNYSTLTWSDWHVQLINGTIVPGSVTVIKSGSSVPWTITYAADPGYDSGFSAIGWPPAELVAPGDVLSVYFLFDPISPMDRVTISQWPTTDFVPEPGSFAALGMGLASLGFALRRRRA